MKSHAIHATQGTRSKPKTTNPYILARQLQYIMIVVVGNGVLHYSTRTERGSDVGFSSGTVPTLYSCPSISGAFWGLQGFWKCQKWSRSLEVIQNWSIVQREGSVEVKYEARSLE